MVKQNLKTLEGSVRFFKGQKLISLILEGDMQYKATQLVDLNRHFKTEIRELTFGMHFLKTFLTYVLKS